MTLYLKYSERPKGLKVSVPKGIIVQRLGKRDGFSIDLVDDELVRDKISVDFTMGMNFCRGSYVPEGHIWIAKSLVRRGREATILHEIKETKKMLKGMDYYKAHDHANVIERRYRKAYYEQ